MRISAEAKEAASKAEREVRKAETKKLKKADKYSKKDLPNKAKKEQTIPPLRSCWVDDPKGTQGCVYYDKDENKYLGLARIGQEIKTVRWTPEQWKQRMQ